VALKQSGCTSRPPVPLFAENPTISKMSRQGDMDGFPHFEGVASTAYSSPAIPTVFDLGQSTSSSTTDMATVSPQDLLIHDPYMSAPNSTALTVLTSPSMGTASPEFTDCFDMSPHFGGHCDLDSISNEHWFPLFPQETGPHDADHSPAQNSDELDAPSPASHQRRRSMSRRHSSVSGVKSKRRDKPLGPIVVEDPHDVVAVKRARNTLAARKSRERKAQRLEELEDKIIKLEAERDHWKALAEARRGDLE